MQIQTISTKELRLNFPLVRNKLSKGISFVLIHRSKPLAIIQPLQNYQDIEWPLDKIVGGFKLQAKIKQKITPEFIKKIKDSFYG